MQTAQALNTTNPRGPLLLLHITFFILYSHELHSLLPTRLQGGLILGLAILTLLVLTLPRVQLIEPWFMALLTLGDSAVLFSTLHEDPNAASWMSCALMLLLAIASQASSALQIVVLSSLPVTGYGLSLHRLGLMDADALSTLAAFLCLVFVFLTKTRIAHAEVQRIAETEEKARSESMSDALTGLPNRAQFIERVTRSIQCRRQTRDFEFAVIFIDLDGFKPINDTLGHKAGDAVLRHTAKRLNGCLRKGDIVGRYGGDEFTLLINNVSGASDAVRVAERVLRKLKEPIHVGEDVHVGASIGIALSTNVHDAAEDLIRDADTAMYRAKAQGKNCFVISDQSVDTPQAELKERWKRMAGAAR